MKQSKKGEEEDKHIHVILKKNRIKKFEILKTENEMNSDVDVVRMCIDKTYEQRNLEMTSIRPELRKILNNFTQNSYLRSKYLVFTIEDIVNEAVHQWIQNRRSEINLHSFSMRKELPKEEQIVANAFVENQIKFKHGLQISDLMKLLNDFSEERLKIIINKFLSNGLIEIMTIAEKEYYFAPIP